MFPAMVLIAWRPPSLRRVPASPVPRPLRYYEAATTSRRACPSAYVFASGFRPGSIVRVRCRAPGDVRAHRRARSFVHPALQGPGLFRTGDDGTSQVPWRPLPRLCPALRPRPNRSRLAMSSRSMLPPDPTRRRLRRFHDFEAATGLQRPLSTLHERRCRRPCKTRFRLAGSAFAGRASNPLGRFERFQVTSILLSRAYPDASWAHGRRDFFDLAKLAKAPIAAEIVRRIDELFAIERAINGKSPEVRRAVRQERSKPLVAALKAYMREQLERLSPKNDLAKAIRYMLTRWPSFTRFLDDGRVCLSNNAAERGLRCVAVGRRNWTFAGSDEGGRRAAAVYSLTETCMCGWPPRCKGFDGDFDAGSAACMCPAYKSRPQPLALMRSADRVLSKLARSRRSHVLLVVPISSIDRRVITSISADAPQQPASPRKRAMFLYRSIDLATRQQRPCDSRHLVSERHGGELDWLASDQPSDPAFRKARFTTTPSDRRKSACDQQASYRPIAHLGDPSKAFLPAA